MNRFRTPTFLILTFVPLLMCLAWQGLQAAPPSASDRRLARAFSQGQSEFFVRVRATVLASLPSDHEGIRHQKFLIELSTGQTLLVAHNIDLAPPVRRLRVGETILIYGEYIWNADGGLLHRTHDDPDFLFPHGWIRYRGRKYQ
jgi:hypothetical protein